MAVLITLGLRYLWTLPVMLPANWVFQTVAAEDRPAWHAAIERFACWIGIAPVFAASLPATIGVFGPIRGLAASVLGCVASLIFFERSFRAWRKLPFTCSYLPGKKAVWLLVWYAGIGSARTVVAAATAASTSPGPPAGTRPSSVPSNGDRTADSSPVVTRSAPIRMGWRSAMPARLGRSRTAYSSTSSASTSASATKPPSGSKR